MRQWAVDSSSPEETRELGALLGRLLEPPAVLLLSGDLGAGKTCLVQGVAAGFDVPADEPVTSPSYTLLNVHLGRSPLYHFDLYRLSGEEDLVDLGFDEYLQKDGVTVVEWSNRASGLKNEDLRLHLEHRGEEHRRIRFEAGGRRGELLLARLVQAWSERGKPA